MTTEETGKLEGRLIASQAVGPHEQNRPVNVVESVLQVHARQAPFFVVVVFLEPSSVGVGGGFTLDVGPEPLLWRSCLQTPQPARLLL